MTNSKVVERVVSQRLYHRLDRHHRRFGSSERVVR